jgi:hypothetical protein
MLFKHNAGFLIFLLNKYFKSLMSLEKKTLVGVGYFNKTPSSEPQTQYIRTGTVRQSLSQSSKWVYALLNSVFLTQAPNYI